MSTPIQRVSLLSSFTCLGDRCVDTCCQGWSMQVDAPTVKRYEKHAPELLQSIESDGAGGDAIMRKNPGTGYCVKLENGLCGIQKQYGEKMLGDACALYPRITRALGKTVIMTASASCPEIVRLLFTMNDGLAFEPATADRLPYGLKDYLTPELTPEAMLATHRAFLDAVNDMSVSPERIFARMASAVRSLERINKKDWPEASAFFIRSADARLPEPVPVAEDPFNLLLALGGLIVASQKKISPRLQETISDMEKALKATMDWERVTIRTTDESLPAWQRVKAHWEGQRQKHDMILRRWLAMQLSLALFPFGGLGDSLSDRITIIGVRFATFKLALQSCCAIHQLLLPEDAVVRIAQSLSRFMDHLGEAGFSLSIYNETGWTNEARVRGVLET